MGIDQIVVVYVAHRSRDTHKGGQAAGKGLVEGLFVEARRNVDVACCIDRRGVTGDIVVDVGPDLASDIRYPYAAPQAGKTDSGASGGHVSVDALPGIDPDVPAGFDHSALSDERRRSRRRCRGCNGHRRCGPARLALDGVHAVGVAQCLAHEVVPGLFVRILRRVGILLVAPLCGEVLHRLIIRHLADGQDRDTPGQAHGAPCRAHGIAFGLFVRKGCQLHVPGCFDLCLIAQVGGDIVLYRMKTQPARKAHRTAREAARDGEAAYGVDRGNVHVLLGIGAVIVLVHLRAASDVCRCTRVDGADHYRACHTGKSACASTRDRGEVLAGLCLNRQSLHILFRQVALTIHP